MNSDYLIMFNNDDQPYIAHWGTKKNHKYIAKIGLRYFYSEEELRAYNNKKRNKKSYNYAKKQNKIAKKELKKATKAYTDSVKNQQKAYAYLRDAQKTGNQTNVRRAENLVKDAKKQTSIASQTASSARLNAKKMAVREIAFKDAYDKSKKTINSHKNDSISSIK